MLSALIPLLAVLASPAVAIDVDQTVYFQNLASNLTGAGLNLFLNALTVANTTQLGQDLINNLYQDQPFTIYAPVDAAWESSGLQNPPANRDLHSLLSYHIVGAEINKTTDVADPRQHSIFETALRTETVLLPGDRHQVIVLESAPNVTDPVILIRGDSWNATSIGNPVKYENLIVQPIDKILAVPSPLIKTLSQSGLALKANLGATEFVTFANSLNLSEALEDCHGCTFFVPVNDAFTAVAGQAAALNATQQTALLRNHVLNGTVKYSTEIGSGFNPISAAGSTISFSSNSSGAYFLSGNSTARVVRSDIPVSNGVVHLIDAVFLNTETDENKADQAVSEASSIAASATGGSPVIGNPPSAVASTPAAQTDNAAFSQYGSATKFSVLTVVLAALWA